jgi:hypothetical protein
MVRLKTAELDIVDTLIGAGVANNRAKAIRRALNRTPLNVSRSPPSPYPQNVGYRRRGLVSHTGVRWKRR